MSGLSDALEPIAAWFRGLGMPDVIIHWGHPVMMGIVVIAMGSAVGLTGWKGRTLAQKDPDGAAQSRAEHSKIAPLMFMFLAMGYTGGILSLVVQKQPILESPHFWTGSAVIGLLTLNALFAAIGFGGGVLRSAHAYIGSAILVLFVVHLALGVNLGLSI